ncbi:MAG: multidrug efflux SMR transporter [Pseudomonadota bacterium]
MSGWIYLGIAILLEIVATTLLKLSDGFENYVWGFSSIACYSLCFFAMAPALKLLPVGTVYAIWSGIGIVAIVGIGAFFFDERLALIQYGYIILILVGAVGLRLTTTSSV